MSWPGRAGDRWSRGRLYARILERQRFDADDLMPRPGYLLVWSGLGYQGA